MRTPLVARLGLAALVALTTSPLALAQDQDAPRPRPADEEAPPAFTQPRRGPPHGLPGRLFRQAEPPRLGVTVNETPDGILVAEVAEGSLAAQAGVQPDDLLLSLDGQRLQTAADIRRVLGHAQPGSSLELSVVRAGKGIEKLTVTVPEAPPAPAPRESRADGHRGGFLGVELGEPVEGGGVVVSGVVEETAAWYAGLDDGDVLKSIDDTEVTGPQDVVGAVSSKEPGHLVTLGWERDGSRHETSIRLGHRPHPFGELFRVDPGAGRMLPRFRGQDPQGRLMLPQWRGQAPAPLDGLDDLRALLDGQAPFDFGGFDLHALGTDLHESIRQWAQQLADQLGQDLDLQDAQTLGIRIENGTVTIEQDGETQTFELPPEQAEEIASRIPGVLAVPAPPALRTVPAHPMPALPRVHLLPGRPLLPQPGLTPSPRPRVDATPPHTVRRKACTGPCQGNQGTTTEAGVL